MKKQKKKCGRPTKVRGIESITVHPCFVSEDEFEKHKEEVQDILIGIILKGRKKRI